VSLQQFRYTRHDRDSTEFPGATLVGLRSKTSLDSASTFCQDVTGSLLQAAREEDVDLLVLDNRYSSRVALRNVEFLIKEKVDLAIVFQIDQHLAPLIASRFHEAGIPFVALGTPHPGATYYGLDYYRAGLSGGRFLGNWAKHNLAGPIDEVILVDLSRAGPLPRSRLSGVLDSVSEALRQSAPFRVTWLEGNGLFGPSLEAVRKHLRASRSQRILLSAINDPSAVGGLRALEEAGRAQSCAVLGQDATLVGRTELRRPLSRFIGSVAFFPERWGQALIRLGLDILAQRPVPPATFGRYHLITRDNVNRFYRDDVLLSPAELDALLLRSPGHSRTGTSQLLAAREEFDA